MAGQLRDLLASALNVEAAADSEVQVFLDDRVLTAGQPLTQTLREKAKRSAVLLVLMSPLYPNKSWCMDELGWFFEQASADGRGQEHCTVLLIQPLAEAAWPKLLRDERDKPVNYLNFADAETSLPVLHRRSGWAATAPRGAQAVHRNQGKAGRAAQAARCAAAAERGRRDAAPRRPAGHLSRCEPGGVGALAAAERRPQGGCDRAAGQSCADAQQRGSARSGSAEGAPAAVRRKPRPRPRAQRGRLLARARGRDQLQ